MAPRPCVGSESAHELAWIAAAREGTGIPASSCRHEELDAAGEWYDAQRLGLSLELFDAVEEAIALIIERPAAWQRDSVVAGREIRRFVMRRFPFSIVYYVVEDLVRIVAIAHAKRRPGYWRVRVRHAP